MITVLYTLYTILNFLSTLRKRNSYFVCAFHMMERGGNDFPRERGFGMKIKVNPFAVLLLLFSVFFLDRFPLVCLVFAACAHELSHLCLFHFFGVRTRQLEILPFGIAASLPGLWPIFYARRCFFSFRLCRFFRAGFPGRKCRFCVILPWGL